MSFESENEQERADKAARSRAAIRLAVGHYLKMLRTDARVAGPALLLPSLGTILVFYVPPLIIAHLLGVFGSGGTPSAGELLPWVLAFGGAWFAGEMIWRLGIFFLNRADLRGVERLYKSSMDELLRKDLAFFNDNFTGSLTKRAISYARNYENFVDTFAFEIVHNLLPLIFVGIVLWGYSPWLIVLLVTMLTVTFFTIRPLIKRRQRIVDEREDANTVVSGHISDTITNMEAVRAFAREPEEAEIHARNVEHYMRLSLRSWDFQNARIDMVTSPLYVLTNMLGLIVALAVGGGGILTLESVFLTFSYFGAISRVMWEFNRIYRNLESIITEAAKFTELLLDEPVVNDPDEPEPHIPRDGRVEMIGVRFAYERGPMLFDGFNLSVPSGQKVGLVGRSGGGKTTLTRLLLRFADVWAGAILIGDQDVRALTQADLRSMIAYVPQDPVMFHRSIADNIRIGRPEATDAEVAEVARLAHAAEFIENLSNGYETLVGERGVKLSGGQRQRVAIARAMLKRAPILVLDEATSSLDSESEALIQDALWTLMEDRTAIVIAHRLSTVRRMDRLLVLDQGRIIEQGSHSDLLRHDGVYASLWSHQSGGFLATADDLV